MTSRALLGLVFLAVAGCTGPTRRLALPTMDAAFAPGTIVDTAGRRSIAFAELVAALAKVDVVYVGETHTDPAHHQVQVRVIEALARQRPGIRVGMEMFDRTYQPILDQWSRGQLDEQGLLEKSHWYANWRYPFDLYRPVMASIQALGLRPVALNLPFHIPPKIAVGGIDSLFGDDARHLPGVIDTTDPNHRQYVQSIFEMHRVPGRTDFEKFYQAQCTWEEAMAEAVANQTENAPMVVLAGSGHIREKFGIPMRVKKRTGGDFLTLLPVSADGSARLSDADYLWVTPPPQRPRGHR